MAKRRLYYNMPNDDTPTPNGVQPISQREAALMIAVEQAKADKEAIISEFATADEVTAFNKVRELFSGSVVDAADTVVNLSKYAESESVRGTYSRYIIDTFLGKGRSLTDDPAADFKKFIESLTTKGGDE